jgi:hypothetical protein
MLERAKHFTFSVFSLSTFVLVGGLFVTPCFVHAEQMSSEHYQISGDQINLGTLSGSSTGEPTFVPVDSLFGTATPLYVKKSFDFGPIIFVSVLFFITVGALLWAKKTKIQQQKISE